MITGKPTVEMFLRFDIGKGEHHAVEDGRDGRRIFDRGLPNDEGTLRDLLPKLQAHGTVLGGRPTGDGARCLSQ